jgi:putative Mn2+ efflux pump MntP
MPATTVRQDVIAGVSGMFTGLAAGFIGVGGGEFRIPVLVELLKFSLKLTGGVNLVVGLFTVALGVLRRWGQQSLTRDDLMLVGIMGIVSAAGAAVGVFGRERMPVRPLRVIVCVYLVVVGLWMVYESFAHTEHVLLEPTGMARWILAAVIAFAIAVASGVLGVAGGEIRIPALLYLFGVPIVEAGTLSLAVSVPTVAAGAIMDRRLDGIPNSVIRVALIMGIASAVGVLVGSSFVPYANREVIKGTLGVVLLLATVRLIVGPRH